MCHAHVRDYRKEKSLADSGEPGDDLLDAKAPRQDALRSEEEERKRKQLAREREKPVLAEYQQQFERYCDKVKRSARYRASASQYATLAARSGIARSWKWQLTSASS